MNVCLQNGRKLQSLFPPDLRIHAARYDFFYTVCYSAQELVVEKICDILIFGDPQIKPTCHRLPSNKAYQLTICSHANFFPCCNLFSLVIKKLSENMLYQYKESKLRKREKPRRKHGLNTGEQKEAVLYQNLCNRPGE